MARLRVDVNPNTMKRVYDDAQYSPTLFTLEKLAKALGVKIGDLVEDEPDEHGEAIHP